MTYKKKTPDLITLFFHSPIDDREEAVTSGEIGGKSDAKPVHKRIFRVSKRELFIQTLQVK